MRSTLVEHGPILNERDADNDPRLSWAWVLLLAEASARENHGLFPANTSAGAWGRMLPRGVAIDELIASGHVIREGASLRVRDYNLRSEGIVLAMIEGGKKGAKYGHLGAKYGHLGAKFGKLGGRPKNPPFESLPSHEEAASYDQGTGEVYAEELTHDPDAMPSEDKW